MTALKSLSYFLFPFSRYSVLENKTKTTESFHKEKEYSQQEKNIQEKFEVKKVKQKIKWHKISFWNGTKTKPRLKLFGLTKQT